MLVPAGAGYWKLLPGTSGPWDIRHEAQGLAVKTFGLEQLSFLILQTLSIVTISRAFSVVLVFALGWVDSHYMLRRHTFFCKIICKCLFQFSICVITRLLLLRIYLSNFFPLCNLLICPLCLLDFKLIFFLMDTNRPITLPKSTSSSWLQKQNLCRWKLSTMKMCKTYIHEHDFYWTKELQFTKLLLVEF